MHAVVADAADEINKARLLIFSRRPGDQLLFRIFRDGSERDIRVKAGTLPDLTAGED